MSSAAYGYLIILAPSSQHGRVERGLARSPRPLAYHQRGKEQINVAGFRKEGASTKREPMAP